MSLLTPALDGVNGYLEHYGFTPLGSGELWEEGLERIYALLRHMEDVLPSPAPRHPLYPERYP